MEKTTDTEAEIIAALQALTAEIKAGLVRLDSLAGRLVTINHVEGRLVQSADAMAWQSAVGRALSDLRCAHAGATKALIAGYANGGEIVAYGPIR